MMGTLERPCETSIDGEKMNVGFRIGRINCPVNDPNLNLYIRLNVFAFHITGPQTSESFAA